MGTARLTFNKNIMESRAQMTWDGIKDTVIVSAVGAAALAIWKYFQSISNKVDRSDFEKLKESVRSLEDANHKYVTHEELKSTIAELKIDIKSDFAELRQELRGIGDRIDRISRQP